MPTSIRKYAGKDNTPETSKAKSILEYAHVTASSLLEAFHGSLDGPGAPTDEKQDLLRSMLVFAGAGLDSSIKQATRDCLPVLARDSEETRGELEKFIEREIRTGGSQQFLVRLLLHSNAEDEAITAFVNDQTNGSLQSVEALKRICNILGVQAPTKKINDLRPAFNARNAIIHEMDMDFSAINRNRRSRTQDQMVIWTNQMLEVAGLIVDELDARIADLQ